MSKPASRSQVLALCLQRSGIREGRKVAQFIFEWEMAASDAGRKISVEEFAVWWKESRATAYRRLAKFRAAFPELGEHGKPDDLMTLHPAGARIPGFINLSRVTVT